MVDADGDRALCQKARALNWPAATPGNQRFVLR